VANTHLRRASDILKTYIATDVFVCGWAAKQAPPALVANEKKWEILNSKCQGIAGLKRLDVTPFVPPRAQQKPLFSYASCNTPDR
jgi:hypothetical protein